MLGNILGFGRMHETNLFVSFYLLKKETNLKILRFFFEFFLILEIFWRKSGILISGLYFIV